MATNMGTPNSCGHAQDLERNEVIPVLKEGERGIYPLMLFVLCMVLIPVEEGNKQIEMLSALVVTNLFVVARADIVPVIDLDPVPFLNFPLTNVKLRVAADDSA